MDDTLQQSASQTRLYIDEISKDNLLATIKWSKFIAIVGYVMLGLFIFLGIIIGLTGFAFLGNATEAYGASEMKGASGMMMVIYLLIGLLYFFPTYYLFKFSTLTKQALLYNNQIQFNEALDYQRKMFRFIGILLIVTLCVYGLMLLLLTVFMTAFSL